MDPTIPYGIFLNSLIEALKIPFRNPSRDPMVYSLVRGFWRLWEPAWWMVVAARSPLLLPASLTYYPKKPQKRKVKLSDSYYKNPKSLKG